MSSSKIIFHLILISIFINGCTKNPYFESKEYKNKLKNAKGFRIHGSIDDRLEAYVLTTYRSTVDPDKIKECSSYNAWRAGSSRKRILDFATAKIKEPKFDVKIPIDYIGVRPSCGMEYVDTRIRFYRKGSKQKLLSEWILFSIFQEKYDRKSINYIHNRYYNKKFVQKGEWYTRKKGSASSAMHNPVGTGSGSNYSSKDAMLYEVEESYFFLNNKLDFGCETYFRKSDYSDSGWYGEFSCYPTNFKQAKGLDEIPNGVIDIELHINVNESKQKFMTYEMQKELR